MDSVARNWFMVQFAIASAERLLGVGCAIGTLLSPPPSNLSADAMANCTMKPISCNAVHQPCLPSCQSCEPTCSSNPSRSPIPETSLIAGAIHHDLGGHRILPLQATGILRAVSANAQPNNRTFAVN